MDFEMEQVDIISSESVSPAREFDHPPKFALSPFDELMRYAGYQRRILFYKSAPEDVVDLLKNSLAEVLVFFYPFASRMRAGDGISSPYLELDCSSVVALTAKFTIATTTKTLDELGYFEPSEFCDSLCQVGSPPPTYPWKLDDPLLFVQVTRFGCGGVSLGVGFSHQVADGVSFWHFMTSWAEIARTGQMSSPLPEISYNYKGLELSDEEYMKVAMEMGGEVVPMHDWRLTGARDNAPVATRQYRFDRSAIAELKSRAAAGDSGARFSTYVVLCADFWRKMVIAQGLPDSHTARFFVLANCRGRIDSLPSSYFGNAISGLQAIASVGELKNRGLPFAARTIRDRIRAFDGAKAERFLSTANWMLQAPRPVRLTPYCQSVSSNQHPVEKSEFGFGKPSGITFGTSDLHEGKAYLFPSSDGDVVVTAVLKQEDMERLIEQEGN